MEVSTEVSTEGAPMEASVQVSIHTSAEASMDTFTEASTEVFTLPWKLSSTSTEKAKSQGSPSIARERLAKQACFPMNNRQDSYEQSSGFPRIFVQV